MSKTLLYSEDLNDLIFRNQVPAGSIFEDLGDGISGATTAGSLHVSLHTDLPNEVGGDQTVNEADFGSYARVAVSRATGEWTLATVGTTRSRVSNTNAINFPQATADANNPNEIRYWGVGTDASGAGNLLYFGHFGDPLEFFTVDDSAVVDTIIMPDHTLSDADEVIFLSAAGASLPSGITEGTRYFVVNSSADQFQIEATVGGGAINIGNGDGRGARLTPKSVDTNDTFTIAAGDLRITED